MTPDLILCFGIPWNVIRGSDLEELLYWLFNSMGAKDLEWGIRGKGRDAADQGRDLELAFFTPSPDGTLTRENIARCCISCNVSKGAKELADWLESKYCTTRGITAESVAEVVRAALGCPARVYETDA